MLVAPQDHTFCYRQGLADLQARLARAMAVNEQDLRAKSFKDLHRSGSPIFLANVYDAASAKAVASLSQAKAIATASYAVAASAGLKDDDLDLDTNIHAAGVITNAVADSGLPVSVDLQDGYENHLSEAVKNLIRIGVVGINLEDYSRESSRLYDIEEAAARIKETINTASSEGVPNFVVNARCDALVHGLQLPEVIARGKAYLAAGATTVFVWGGPSRGGISRAEVAELVEAFGGRLNAWMKLSGGLNGKELAEIGVARIGVGPTLQMAAMERFKQAAEDVLNGLV